MPFYRYKCKRCKKEFSFMEKMSEERKRICPECLGELERVFTPVDTIYKSDGFYKKEGKKDG